MSRKGTFPSTEDPYRGAPGQHVRGDTEPFGGGVLWRAFCALFNDLFFAEINYIFIGRARERRQR